MNHKKIIFHISVISLAFLLFILWHQITFVRPAQTLYPSISNYKIYLITTDKEYQYWDILNEGAADLASDLGIKYIWDAPAVRDVNEQIDIIRNAVDEGAYALLVAADDPKRISYVIEDAKAKSVKIIYVDSPAFEEAIVTLATDNYKAGVLAGEAMISELHNMGAESGSIGIVSVAQKENTKQREEGFRDTLMADGRYQLLDTVYTNGEPDVAQENAVHFMEYNKDLIGLFGTNEGTSRGVGYAIKENDNKYIGVGFDKTDIMMQLLSDGNLKAIIVQNPYTMGYLGMAEAVAAIRGYDTGPSFIDTGVSVLRSR